MVAAVVGDNCGRVLLCGASGRAYVVADRRGIVVYEFDGEGWRVSLWVPAVNVRYVDVDDGRVYLKSGDSLKLPCASRKVAVGVSSYG